MIEWQIAGMSVTARWIVNRVAARYRWRVNKTSLQLSIHYQSVEIIHPCFECSLAVAALPHTTRSLLNIYATCSTAQSLLLVVIISLQQVLFELYIPLHHQKVCGLCIYYKLHSADGQIKSFSPEKYYLYVFHCIALNQI